MARRAYEAGNISPAGPNNPNRRIIYRDSTDRATDYFVLQRSRARELRESGDAVFLRRTNPPLEEVDMEPALARIEAACEHRVLWVEGHPDNREFLAVFLATAGYAVTSCDSVRQATKIVSDRHFDVYIVGDCLPIGSSLRLAAQIKSANPRAPLILYSALAFATDVERGIQTGAQAYITKPGNLDNLLDTISRLLTRDDSTSRVITQGDTGHERNLSSRFDCSWLQL